ncbi:hypothetical protein BaRGS_00022828 [Batillaria attramentaria]|uniref:Uncharacterized protein n=1 Tax=Batillaria attramentaria TaxID=370345 RepID=A0ABD0KGF0_9CAEN
MLRFIWRESLAMRSFGKIPEGVDSPLKKIAVPRSHSLDDRQRVKDVIALPFSLLPCFYQHVFVDNPNVVCLSRARFTSDKAEGRAKPPSRND